MVKKCKKIKGKPVLDRLSSRSMNFLWSNQNQKNTKVVVQGNHEDNRIVQSCLAGGLLWSLFNVPI